MTVEISRRYARPFRFEGDSLTFWVYPEFELTTENSPRLYLQDLDKYGTAAITLVQGQDTLPAKRWSLVTLPLASFRPPAHNGTDDPKFNQARFVSLFFLQGLDDPAERTVYFNDFQIRDAASGDSTPPDAPGALQVRGYDRHIDVSWRPSEAKDVLAYRIYRSSGDGPFEPIGTQQVSRHRFLDFIGKESSPARYRMTAFDVAVNESSPSEISTAASTRSHSGDLVETAFMIQGLLAARQYFDRDTPVEREVRDTITRLWHAIEWDWYRKNPDSPVLYWHWSPGAGFHISHPLIGWNETMIVYLLAIASPTHPVPAELYHTGWAGTSEKHVAYRRGWSRTQVGGRYVNGNTYYGQKLEVGVGNGSDLFFVHFSFMGFDPRGRRDAYTNYFENNRAITRINYEYCVQNPRGFVGYGKDTWGLSVGINAGGGKPNPRDDNGTISIMASQASMPYTPEESLRALNHLLTLPHRPEQFLSYTAAPILQA